MNGKKSWRAGATGMLTGSASMAIIAAFLMTGTSRAQEASGGETMLEPITVRAAKVARGGVELDEDDLDRVNPSSIKDVFSGEAAVNVGGGHDSARKVYVNGVEDTNLNVTIDGARQVNSAFHHLGTAIIDPGLLKSVSVETGVGYMDAGPGALGGSIAYETKDARDILEDGDSFGGFTRLQFDTNPQAHTEVLTVAARHGNFEALAYGSNNGGDLYEDGGGVEVAGTRPNMKNLLGKLAFSNRDGARFELQADRLEDAGVRPNRANFGALTNGAPPTFQRYERDNYSFSYRDEHGEGLLNPELSLSYSRATHFIDELAFGPSTFDLNSETTSWNGKIANNFSTGLGIAEEGSVNVGLDFYRDQGRGDIEGGFGGNIPLVNTETSENVGLFVQSRLDLTGRLHLAVGGRYDRQWFEGIDGTDIEVGGPSGTLNVEYDFLPWLTGYAGAGSVFGGIPLGESAIYNFASQWSYEGLSNSRSYNYKAGVNGKEGPFSGDAHIYRTEIRGSHDRGSAVRNSTRNLKSYGFNLSGKYATREGHVRASYSNNTFRSDGLPLASGSASFHGLQMGDLMTLEGAKYWDGIGLVTGASAELALKDDNFENAANKTYLVANLYAEYMPENFDRLTMRVDVKNLFDRTYVARATSGVDNASVIPFNEPGRSFLFSAKLDF